MSPKPTVSECLNNIAEGLTRAAANCVTLANLLEEPNTPDVPPIVVDPKPPVDPPAPSRNKFVGLNALAPEFYRSAKPWKDMGPHGSLRVVIGDGHEVDSNGWLRSGKAIVSYDTFVPYSWPVGEYELRWTGSGSVKIDLPGASEPPFFNVSESTGRIMLTLNGEVSGISIRPKDSNGSAFTLSILDRASKAVCYRFMDAQYINEPKTQFDSERCWINQQDSGSLRFYHHGWTYYEMIQLGIETGCDIWLNIHPNKLADKKFLKSLAQQFTAVPGKVLVEFGNEAFNSSKSFAYNAWLNKHRGSQGLWGFHADCSDAVYEIFKSVDSEKFVGVLGNQAAANTASQRMADMMKSKTRPLAFVDKLAIAPYMGTSWVKQSSDVLAGYDVPTAIAEIESNFDSVYKPEIEDWQRITSAQGWQLVCYEFGTELFAYLDPNVPRNVAAISKIHEVNESAEMGGLYKRVLDWWDKLTDGALLMHYADVDGAGLRSWGAMLDETRTTPRWDALAQYMK